VLDSVHELAADDAPAGTVVIAEQQSAGRGRDGRTWHSSPGGIWLGLLLRPTALELTVTAIRTGLAIAGAVDRLAGRAAVALKWPNDVMLEDRKLAGVLCEGRWQGEAPQWLAVGVGINVVNAIPIELQEQAIALREVLPTVRRIDVLDMLMPALLSPALAGGRLTAEEIAAFDERHWLRGRQLVRPVSGRADGIAPDGALMVEAASGTVYVRDGHVQLA
jgi:BirA family biotin operon repressor/biotin-[acetyl-CoA-carboxylase] ligase